ncbi:WD40/YVTN/BNR-like repeat-containing protein [Halosimplex salinum]|uniref:WD40/YVTN/BNR-like repeat-containing protein n=1 Tax=Halosimplex salinum TaxID=1710538 RepID=UPI000F4982DE|nr:WD40 repeat domain-containing protein [Halosimplex salinum]
MLFAGSDDGVYRFSGIDASDESTPTQVLDSGRVLRLRTFDARDGLFAATTTGLFHSPDGEAWTDLGVPEDRVYAVGASGDGSRLYAGTRPAHVYVAEQETAGGPDDPDGPDDSGDSDDSDDFDSRQWRECEGFQTLPSREEWRLPRHEDLAQVRDVHADPAAPDRIVAGVEVGGVHVSDDGGETWAERREGVNDDIHELHVVGPGEYVAATGFGLFRTTDGGESWTRLDEGFDQRYFRTAFSVDGTVYAAGALANSSTWDDPAADPELFALRDDTLERVAFPAPDETVTGTTAVDGALVVATHRGSVFARRGDEWDRVGDLPVAADQTGRYTPLARFEG